MEIFPLILIILGTLAGVAALFTDMRAAAGGVILIGAGILIQFA